MLNHNKEKIDWYSLSANPNAIFILENNINKIDWYNLSENPNALDILKNNQEKINWYMLSLNPNIFTIDYTKIKDRTYIYLEEYSKKMFLYFRFTKINPYKIFINENFIIQKMLIHSYKNIIFIFCKKKQKYNFYFL